MSSLSAVVDDGLRAGQVRVRVPATSANLGPGYDCFGLALDLYDEVVAERSAGGLEIDIVGVGAGDVPRDANHLVVKAAARGFAALGEELPALRLRCTNTIPHGSGQGSSAAAIVSGILAARSLCPDGERRLPDAAVFDLATGMEGHPDNVAPALWGGFTIAWTSRSAGGSGTEGSGTGGSGTAGSAADGAGTVESTTVESTTVESTTAGTHPVDTPPVEDRHARMVRLTPHRDLTAIVWTADQFCATDAARAALPAMIPHRDAAENSAHAALLVHAITTDPALLLQATQDRLHQPYRAAVMPRTAALLGTLRARGIAAVLSGAGPSVLALGTDLPAIDAIDAPGFVARRVVPATTGASVARGR